MPCCVRLRIEEARRIRKPAPPVEGGDSSEKENDVRAFAFVLLAVTACNAPSGPAPAAPVERPSRAAGIPNPAAPCVDQWLREHGLNPYGDPPDTAYAGGSPLFDEKRGIPRDRVASVLARHPEIARACLRRDGGLPEQRRLRDGGEDG